MKKIKSLTKAPILDVTLEDNGNGEIEALTLLGRSVRVEKVYTRLGPMTMQIEADEGGPYRIIELITNATPHAWTRIHWALTLESDAEFVSAELLSQGPDPFTDLTYTPDGIEASGGVVPPGGTFRSTWIYEVSTARHLTIGATQYPTVPEPATLALVGLGLSGIGWRRKVSFS